MDYKSTLNLPKTDFAMQAGLPKREPEMLKAWEDNNIYEKEMKKNEGRPVYVLHDGPPLRPLRRNLEIIEIQKGGPCVRPFLISE